MRRKRQPPSHTTVGQKPRQDPAAGLAHRRDTLTCIPNSTFWMRVLTLLLSTQSADGPAECQQRAAERLAQQHGGELSCRCDIGWVHEHATAACDLDSECQGCAMQTAGATATVASTMQKASGAMAAMGAAADPQAMQQNMAAFSRENQRMDMASGLTYLLIGVALAAHAVCRPVYIEQR